MLVSVKDTAFLIAKPIRSNYKNTTIMGQSMSVRDTDSFTLGTLSKKDSLCCSIWKKYR